MSSGCVPKKADRLAIIKKATELTRKALKILEDNPDPDKAKREIEEACSFLGEAVGDFYGPDPLENGMLQRLMEHYFS